MHTQREINIGCAGMTGILILLVVVLRLEGCGASTQQASPPAAVPLTIGTEGRLTTGDVDVVVGKDAQAEQELSQAAAAGDKVGYRQIVDQGRAYLVLDGTRAKLLGYGDGLMGADVYHVRILSGSASGQDGWVPMEWMKR